MAALVDRCPVRYSADTLQVQSERVVQWQAWAILGWSDDLEVLAGICLGSLSDAGLLVHVVGDDNLGRPGLVAQEGLDVEVGLRTVRAVIVCQVLVHRVVPIGQYVLLCVRQDHLVRDQSCSFAVLQPLHGLLMSMRDEPLRLVRVQRINAVLDAVD